MHLVFLGVMRKFLNTWVKGSLPFRLGPRSVKELNLKIVSMINYIPKEFHRKPRSLNEIDNFKATEFRMLLLYTGIPALNDVLPVSKYKHFLLLQCAAYVLLSESADNREWNDFAKCLLRKFVSNVPKLYCQEFLIYNVHNLLHIHEDALNFGNLNKVDCFPFEDFIQKLKKVVRGKKHFVQQVVRRAHEVNAITENFGINSETRSRIPQSGVTWNGFFLSNSVGDNCFRTKSGKVVLVTEVFKDVRYDKM
jgi:hypothetical protein